MARLVDVMKENQILNRRQLPLVIDENLTMVLDLNGLNLVCDNVSVRGRQLEDFMRKYSILTLDEVTEAFQVNYKHLQDILDQTIPCIGCRKSVERVFSELSQSSYPALSPLIITEDGILTIQEEYLTWPNHLCSLLHGHSTKLNTLASSWPAARTKVTRAARRCPLHSLDSARYVTRPPLSYGSAGCSSGWREAWDCMRSVCKEQVVLIESCVLLATLETYLRKHRFCGECRTKVMRAYTLLVEEKDPHKEKGFVASLYAGIRRCLADRHIHLELRTEFIASLIARAEPELIGNRRERHAKTLEIAQEEVLTCIGICVYERLHKIQMKLKEEQCTYQVLATVAVEALCRNFETVVEEKQGVSQLELCYLDMIRDDQVKEQRRELKKLKKRKRREERKLQLMKQQLSQMKETFECENCAELYTEDEEHACAVKSTKLAQPASNTTAKPKATRSKGGKTNEGLKGSGKEEKVKTKRKSYSEAKAESVDTDDNCVCDECFTETMYKESSLKVKSRQSSLTKNKSKKPNTVKSESNSVKISGGPTEESGVKDLKKSQETTSSLSSKKSKKKSKISGEETNLQSTSSMSSVTSVEATGTNQTRNLIGKTECCGSVDKNGKELTSVPLGNHRNGRDDFAVHSNGHSSLGNGQSAFGIHTECSLGSDGGYTSGNNSTLSSPANSEVACSDGFCNHEGPEDCPVDSSQSYDVIHELFHSKLSLEQMLLSCHGNGCCEEEEEDQDDWIPKEEVEKFKARVQNVEEKRQRLRATLMQRFQNMCDRSRAPF